MEIHTNIPLKNYTTMRLGGPARFMADITRPDQIPALVNNARQQSLSIAMLGGGSNTIVKDEGFNGIVLRMRIMGIEVVGDDLNTTTLRVGAGVNWDDLVKYTVEQRLTGIEAMSAIPGTVGAAPVQNIGAYGQELSGTFVSLEAYDLETNDFVTLGPEDCQFSYRSSIFRTEASGRYIITSVTLTLSKNLPSPPFYAALQDYLDARGVTTYLHQVIRDAVIDIRQNKLPDPKQLPNAGSFFKNPVVESWLFNDIQQQFPKVPHYDMPGDKAKIPAGWLIEQAGFKGKALNGIKIHDANALVLINQSATSFSDLKATRDEIVAKVRDMFRIGLEQEPLEL